MTIDDAAEAASVEFSNRGFVEPGSEVLVSSLVIVGSSARTILVRGLGPALASASASGVGEWTGVGLAELLVIE